MTNYQRMMLQQLAQTCPDREIVARLETILKDKVGQEFERQLSETLRETEILQRLYYGESLESIQKRPHPSEVVGELLTVLELVQGLNWQLRPGEAVDEEVKRRALLAIENARRA